MKYLHFLHSDTIQAVCLPEHGEQFSEDDECYVAGYGRTQCKFKLM